MDIVRMSTKWFQDYLRGRPKPPTQLEEVSKTLNKIAGMIEQRERKADAAHAELVGILCVTGAGVLLGTATGLILLRFN